MKPASTFLREEAANRACQVRMPGICAGGPCVLAHVRLPGISGTGMKAPDILASWCCSTCHDEYDRRTRRIAIEDAERWFYEGCLRTQYQLWREGKLMEMDGSHA